MFTYTYGGKYGKSHTLIVSDDMVVVRAKTTRSLSPASDLETALDTAAGKQVMTQLAEVCEFQDANVVVYQCRGKGDPAVIRDHARQVLKQEEEVRFAGRVLQDVESGTPVVYTENLFIKFFDHVAVDTCETILRDYHLEIKEPLQYAANAYFASVKEGLGFEVFPIANQLLRHDLVEYCHPELIWEANIRAIHPMQWHLAPAEIYGVHIRADIQVEAAWMTTRGDGMVIAVIDDGFDIDHEELNAPGKIVHPRDVTLRNNDPRPKTRFENHGTACAGVACAAGKFQASGVAPDAKLMPIRLRSGLGSQSEAKAFVWAADHGADVISCSWGPPDGDWMNPHDSRHKQVIQLPDSTRLAIDYATRNGRSGKGCVIVWAAGNGNESADHDGYVSYANVITVAASNDRNTRSAYSDYGQAIWCSFPSSDFAYWRTNHPAPVTPGIWTTDRSGNAGYNPGVLNPVSFQAPGDDHGHYTERFGGTSSSAPGVAGIAALVLAANPNLRWDQVKEILRRSAVRIDPIGGNYDEQGHSPFYGYGRADAAQAVELAKRVRPDTG